MWFNFWVSGDFPVVFLLPESVGLCLLPNMGGFGGILSSNTFSAPFFLLSFWAWWHKYWYFCNHHTTPCDSLPMLSSTLLLVLGNSCGSGSLIPSSVISPLLFTPCSQSLENYCYMFQLRNFIFFFFISFISLLRFSILSLVSGKPIIDWWIILNPSLIGEAYFKILVI